MKKFSVFLSLLFIILGFATFAAKHPVSASGATPAAATSCENVLGFVSWNCNVNLNILNEDELKINLWLIVANVATDLTVAAAYLVLGFVIYGGYFYICANGDSAKVATGKKIFAQAFIGLAIVMSVSVIMGTIRTLLSTNLNDHCIAISDDPDNPVIAGSCNADPGTIVTSLIQWVIGVAGFLAVAFVVFGGISLTTSSGDPTKVQKAKNTIIYALIGLALVAAAEIITAFVSNLIRESAKNAYLPSSSRIARLPAHSSFNHTNKKEYYEITIH